MSFLHDIIKIKYIHDGYLHDHRPEQISDSEMCDAFLAYPDDSYTDDERWDMYMNSAAPMWFKDRYDVTQVEGFDELTEDLKTEWLSRYRTLVEAVVYHINEFKASTADNKYLPTWVYSYMLGDVISYTSSLLDIHDMLVLMDIDNMSDTFTIDAVAGCYATSSKWLQKLPEQIHRPPALFGEPHIIKSLRLSQIKM